MENRKKPNYIKTISVALVVIACVAVCAALSLPNVTGFFRTLFGVLSPFLYGFIIAYLCNPFYNLYREHVFAFIERKKKHSVLRKVCAIVLTFITFFAIIAAILMIIIPQVVESIRDLVGHFNEYVEQMKKWGDMIVQKLHFVLGEYEDFSDFWDNSDVTKALKEAFVDPETLTGTILPILFPFARNIVTEAYHILFGIVISVYFLAAKERILASARRLCNALMSRKHYESTIAFGRLTNKTFTRFLIGKLIDAAIVGILFFVVFSIFGFPYAPLLSVILGVTNIIPFFGPFIGLAPDALIVLIAAPDKLFVLILIVIAVQAFDGNVLSPKILGNSTGISALGVIVAITVFGGLFGILGMIIGVPICAVISILLRNFTEGKLHRAKKPVPVNYYYADDIYKDEQYLTAAADLEREPENPEPPAEPIPSDPPAEEPQESKEGPAEPEEKEPSANMEESK